VWSYPHLWKAVSAMNIFAIKDIMTLIMRYAAGHVSSEHFIKLAHKYHNPHLEKLIVHVANELEPIPGMLDILTDLHRAGHQQHIASNIGMTSFLALTDPKQYPAFAPIFSLIDLKKSQIISIEDSESPKKPAPAFFQTYLKKNSIDLAVTPVIFIDTAGKGFEERLEEGSQSRYNLEEADIVLSQLEKMLALGVKAGDIAVINAPTARR
jgi:beta-phosphoglucomutase-like phosphatase (HAD superfamily)